MSITTEEWHEYKDYLQSLTTEELEIELKWLDTLGIAKKRGSTIASVQTDTLH
jgi:hypothetical protein